MPRLPFLAAGFLNGPQRHRTEFVIYLGKMPNKPTDMKILPFIRRIARSLT